MLLPDENALVASERHLGGALSTMRKALVHSVVLTKPGYVL